MNIINLLLIILGGYLILLGLIFLLALTLSANRICPQCHRKKKWNNLGWKLPCRNCK